MVSVTPLRIDKARRLLSDAVAARAFPAATVEVGDATRPLWRDAFGRLSYDTEAPAATEDTLFDLASLTKVLATTPLVMQALERGRYGLDDPIADHVSAWRGDDRRAVTIRDLLAHCSGLPAYRPLYLRERGDEAFLRVIAALSFDYAPRSRHVYSDLDMMLLGFMLGGSAELPRALTTMLGQMGVVDPLQYRPPALWQKRIAPTAFDRWRGRLLVGEVDDANGWALDGVSGHAGLFGTASAVGSFARHLLQILDGRVGLFQRDTVVEFATRRSEIPDSSRALGWDTMLPTSSCGTKMSSRSFGHTGFTGTSLWIDPDRGIYVVLLTNRVHPDRLNGMIAGIRPAFHDAVIEGMSG